MTDDMKVKISVHMGTFYWKKSKAVRVLLFIPMTILCLLLSTVFMVCKILKDLPTGFKYALDDGLSSLEVAKMAGKLGRCRNMNGGKDIAAAEIPLEKLMGDFIKILYLGNTESDVIYDAKLYTREEAAWRFNNDFAGTISLRKARAGDFDEKWITVHPLEGGKDGEKAIYWHDRFVPGSARVWDIELAGLREVQGERL